jgi:uncharacterized protein (DUF1800 family)
VPPFVSRQLIQRLVTSNPSPAYVGRVAAAFADNGAGVRGDLQAVLRAILLDPEARGRRFGHGPQLRQAARARGALPELGACLRRGLTLGPVARRRPVGPGEPLGQSPMRSPSVFNFFRPGYVPPGGAVAAAA